MPYCDDLIAQSEQLFGKRTALLSLWQCMADNFYPERADFTAVRNLGEDFASNLSTSYPIMARAIWVMRSARCSDLQARSGFTRAPPIMTN